jgi:hypothetical protein
LDEYLTKRESIVVKGNRKDGVTLQIVLSGISNWFTCRIHCQEFELVLIIYNYVVLVVGRNKLGSQRGDYGCIVKCKIWVGRGGGIRGNKIMKGKCA